MTVQDEMEVIRSMLEGINKVLLEVDESFTKNDTNTALKKTHEAILLVKNYKEGVLCPQ